MKPEVKLVGVDGNAFAIMGACKKAWIKFHGKADGWEAIQKEMMSGNYDNLLATAMKHFEVQ